MMVVRGRAVQVSQHSRVEEFGCVHLLHDNGLFSSGWHDGNEYEKQRKRGVSS